MINGSNARLVFIMLFIMAFLLVISIVLLSALHDNVPSILVDTLESDIGVLVGSIALNVELPKSGNK